MRAFVRASSRPCLCIVWQHNGWHGNILKPFKHSSTVVIYYPLKFAVNDLCLRIFKQIHIVWEHWPSNSNCTNKNCLLVQRWCSNKPQSLTAVRLVKGSHQKHVYRIIYIPVQCLTSECSLWEKKRSKMENNNCLQKYVNQLIGKGFSSVITKLKIHNE